VVFRSRWFCIDRILGIWRISKAFGTRHGSAPHITSISITTCGIEILQLKDSVGYYFFTVPAFSYGFCTSKRVELLRTPIMASLHLLSAFSPGVLSL
jgi:hypothetical protein